MKRAYDQDHRVNDIPMLIPDVDIEITYEDLEAGDSGLDEYGYYHRTVARADKRTWKFKYAALTKEEFAYLRSLLKGKKTFRFTFRDENDKTETVDAYCKPMSVVWQSKRSGLYKNLTVEIVAC